MVGRLTAGGLPHVTKRSSRIVYARYGRNRAEKKCMWHIKRSLTVRRNKSNRVRKTGKVNHEVVYMKMEGHNDSNERIRYSTRRDKQRLR